MASHHHSEGIRLQAERVVVAYNEIRDTANSANFKSDEFPVGLFAALIQEIQRLEGWLEPAEPADRIAAVRDLTDGLCTRTCHARAIRCRPCRTCICPPPSRSELTIS